MPTFDFLYWTQENGATLTRDGPIIPVEVSMPTALEEFCTQKGIMIPPPQSDYALIDTGASATSMDESVLQQLSILPIDRVPCSSTTTTDKAFVYPTRISMPTLNLKDFSLARVIGCKLKWKTTDGKEIIMLVGRDILQYMVMIYNGRNSSLTLAF